jgi:hypothetical protein
MADVDQIGMFEPVIKVDKRVSVVFTNQNFKQERVSTVKRFRICFCVIAQQGTQRRSFGRKNEGRGVANESQVIGARRNNHE